MKYKVEDFIGKSFGKLTVVDEVERKIMPNGKLVRQFLVKCSCGNTAQYSPHQLLNGSATTCGCGRADRVTLYFNKTTHGLSRHPLYDVYKQMLSRCYDSDNSRYTHYGERGIVVCDRWLGNNGLLNFFEDMLPTYKEGLSIHRVDNNGDYSPLNCVWENNSIQSHVRGKFSNSTSRYIGVSRSHYSKTMGCYMFCAKIQVEGNKFHIGTFLSEYEAAVAYDNKSEELYGDRPNSTTRYV